MANARANLRLIRLESVSRLRRLGAWPWLLLLGWSLLAAAQEPRLLRGFEIYLGWQGTWSGATILLIALASMGEVSGTTGYQSPALRFNGISSSAVGLLLTGLVALAQMLFSWLAELTTGAASPAGFALVTAAGFVVALAPASIACITLLPRWGSSIVARFGLVLALAYSLAASPICFREFSVNTTGASALIAVGAIFVALFASTVTANLTPHAYRHPR